MKLQALRSRLNRIAPFPSETSMKTPFLLLAALGGLTTASAEIPNSLLFQGYLTQGNAPLTGEQTLLVKACDALTDGTCKAVFSGKVQAANGYYTALLENLPVMDKPYWLEVASNSTLLPSRIALTASPYALRAASSQKADSAGFAVKADTAKFASKADTATVAIKALTSLAANSAQSAAEAMHAIDADNAKTAVTAQSAAEATHAIDADKAKTAKTLEENPAITGNVSISGSASIKSGILTTGSLYSFGFSGTLDFQKIATITNMSAQGWDGGLMHGIYSGRYGSYEFFVQYSSDAGGDFTINSSKHHAFGNPGGIYYYVNAKSIEIWVKKSSSDDYGSLRSLEFPFGTATFSAASSTSLSANYISIPGF